MNRMRRLLVISLWVVVAAPATLWGQSPVDPNCTAGTSNACVDWERGIAISLGVGAPATWAKNAAQKNISAQRAARLDAARNIIELIKGINITGTTSMKQAMVENDEIESSIQGRLAGIRAAGEPKYFSDGSVQVKIVANLREVVPQDLVYGAQSGPPKLLEGPLGSTSGSSLATSNAYTGLIVDARGTGVVPAMAPKIYDPDGREVYGSAYVSREWAISQGVVGYLKDLEKAQGNDRVKGNPAIVKATEATGANKADVVISKVDADSLRAIAQTQSFLSEGRVLIVLD